MSYIKCFSQDDNPNMSVITSSVLFITRCMTAFFMSSQQTNTTTIRAIRCS